MSKQLVWSSLLFALVLAGCVIETGDEFEDELAEEEDELVEEPLALLTGDIVLHAGDGSATIVGHEWMVEDSPTAASGKKIRNYNPSGTAAATINPVASPSDYFEMTFYPRTGKDYRVWIRSWAEGNVEWNDSVSVQFSNATLGGNAAYRIGTTSAMTYSLQDCSGAGLYRWGWQEPNSYGSCGAPDLSFDSAAPAARFVCRFVKTG
jgi:hypothetical protein